MREVAFDVETTGLDPKTGDRIVELGCVELVNHVTTGVSFQAYVNPERDMPEGAFRVHGLSAAFLADKPLFADICDGFLDFIGGDPLVIHNAAFDMGFINAELERLGRPGLPMDRAIDTLKIAQAHFPGARASLDALCKRFSIDNSGRDMHGALLDAELLAEVYLELSGGRQPDLALAGTGKDVAVADAGQGAASGGGAPRPPRGHQPSAEEAARHMAFIETLDDPVWLA